MALLMVLVMAPDTVQGTVPGTAQRMVPPMAPLLKATASQSIKCQWLSLSPFPL